MKSNEMDVFIPACTGMNLKFKFRKPYQSRSCSVRIQKRRMKHPESTRTKKNAREKHPGV